MSTATELRPPSARSSEPARPRLDAQAISRLPMTELLELMTPDRARAALGVLEWLSGPAPRMAVENLVEELCSRFLGAGLPLDRYGSSISMVTAEHDAVARLWERDKGVRETYYVRPEKEDPEYLASPYFVAAETQAWVELWLPDTPDERFGIVASLRQAGYVHYLCMPITLTNDANGWVTFATRRASGFSEQDLMTLALILPALSMRLDARVGWTTLDKLLRTYVGEEPHNAILSGRAKRGQVSTIRAAMLVADLRDSTGHIAALSAVQAVDLFNDLFDCLVPAIEAGGGEVLKYMGDGLLAIFREAREGRCTANDRALAAAQAALEALATFNRDHSERRAMQIGIALHYGEIAYGNVGSGLRLDFTVIGRDVALASRIAAMNAKLNEPLLISAAAAQRLAAKTDRIGLFAARGFADKVEILRPARIEATGTEA